MGAKERVSGIWIGQMLYSKSYTNCRAAGRTGQMRAVRWAVLSLSSGSQLICLVKRHSPFSPVKLSSEAGK